MKYKRYLLLVVFYLSPVFGSDSQFPYRSLYPKLNYISSQQLYNELGKSPIIDIRSKLEFDTVHIKGALNIAFSDMDFLPNIEAIAKQKTNKQVIIYCNGKTCLKSYHAGQLLNRHNINNRVFDEGVMSWLKNFPEQSVLLGKSPVARKDIISEQEFISHQLDYKTFSHFYHSGYLIDIRDIYQRTTINALTGQQPIPLGKMVELLKQGKYKDKPLFFIDATGRQVRWLQYYLEANNYHDYYFLKGGYLGVINSKNN